MKPHCGRTQAPTYRAFWTIEDPFHIKVSPVDQNIFPERVTAREVEVFGFDPVEAESRCKRRLAQYRQNPKRFNP